MKGKYCDKSKESKKEVRLMILEFEVEETMYA